MRLSAAVIAFSMALLTVSSMSFAQARLSDARRGMTCHDYQSSLKLSWLKPGGDWIDAEGTDYGDIAFVQKAISKSKGRQTIEWDITELAEVWNRGTQPSGGIYLRQLADSRSAVNFHSRESDQPDAQPLVVIQWKDSSQTTLKPYADATITCSNFSGNGERKSLQVGNNRSSIVAFPFEPRPESKIASATLIMTSDKQYRSQSNIGVFRLTAPFSKAGQATLGLAKDYKMDADIDSNPAVLFATGFESSNWLDDWSSISASSNVRRVTKNRGSLFEPFSGHALEVTIKKGAKQGINLLYRFKEKSALEPTEMYFRYYLRFGNDWTPREGGKLPGFAGTYNQAGWGGRRPNGTDGWSARGRYAISNSLSSNQNVLGSYLYHASLKSNYGDSRGWNLGPTGIVEKNRWLSVEQYLKLNDPDKSNGILRAWIDGVPVFNSTDLRFRSVDELRIETLWMNVYHGGTSSAPSDMHLYIDNLVIAKQYIGPVNIGSR